MKSLDRLFCDATFLQILARRFRRRGFALKLRFPPLKCPLIQLDDLIRIAFARFKAAVVNQLWQGDAGLLSNDLIASGNVTPSVSHTKVKNEPTFRPPEPLK